MLCVTGAQLFKIGQTELNMNLTSSTFTLPWPLKFGMLCETLEVELF